MINRHVIDISDAKFFFNLPIPNNDYNIAKNKGIRRAIITKIKYTITKKLIFSSFVSLIVVFTSFSVIIIFANDIITNMNIIKLKAK